MSDKAPREHPGDPQPVLQYATVQAGGLEQAGRDMPRATAFWGGTIIGALLAVGLAAATDPEQPGLPERWVEIVVAAFWGGVVMGAVGAGLVQLCLHRHWFPFRRLQRPGGVMLARVAGVAYALVPPAVLLLGVLSRYRPTLNVVLGIAWALFFPPIVAVVIGRYSR